MPGFSSRAIEQTRSATLIYLELLVLGDRLHRLKKSDVDDAYQIQELGTFRSWDTSQHPGWLVFEVEGGLQIRPEQYALARHLLDHPGSIWEWGRLVSYCQ